MFSDIHSVRSQPINPGRPRPRHLPYPSDFESPSQLSRVLSPYRRQHWRNSLHPEVDEKYHLLLKGEHIKWNPALEKQSLKVQNIQSATKSERSEGERGVRQYEEKIRGLEDQNANLREELYYLREALLINFQTRQGKDSRVAQ